MSCEGRARVSCRVWVYHIAAQKVLTYCLGWTWVVQTETCLRRLGAADGDSRGGRDSSLHSFLFRDVIEFWIVSVLVSPG